MRGFKFFMILLLIITISVTGEAQSENPLKLSPLYTAETLIANGISELGLFLITPPMIDPEIDEGSTIFSYFSKPTYQLGLPGEHFGTMVTPEGRLYTGSAELVFFTNAGGSGLKPIEQRIYTLLDGWIPCVQYQYNDHGLIYSVEAFQYWLEGEFKGTPVNFVRFSVKNPGKDKAKAGLAVGYKFGERDHRAPGMKQGKFNPFWTYSFGNNYAKRKDKLIYYFDEAPSARWSIDVGGEARGKFFVLEKWRISSMVEYEFELLPGEERSFSFKFPHYPQKDDAENIVKLGSADYDFYLEQLKNFWSKELNKGMSIYVAEPKVVNASKAALIHNIMSQDYPNEDEIKQSVNRFQYNAFWLRDGAFHARMYALLGRLDDSRKLLRHFLKYQDKSGNFLSQKGQLDGFGQSLWAFGEYVKISDDKKFAGEVLPAVKKAIDWFEKVTSEDEYGLMPPTNAMDNEFIIGRYTGHNLWALAGIDGAIAVAKSAGDEQAVREFQTLREEFARNLLIRISEASDRNNGRIPPGMDVPGGVDWGNLFEVYPDNFLPPDHPLVIKTFDYYRKHKMREGIATYRTAMHHYVTERVAEMAIRQGRQEYALNDFYSMLMHTGSCHQGFEWTIFPFTDRDYCAETPIGQSCNFPPHGWYAVFYNTLLRNMLVREWGNELHLLSVVSPEWTKPGDEIQVNNAPTYFGKVNLKAVSAKDRLTLYLKTEFRTQPDKIVLHFPFFADVSKVLADGKAVEFKPDMVNLKPGTKQVEVFWQLKPAGKYSYQSFVNQYKESYARRYRRHYY